MEEDHGGKWRAFLAYNIIGGDLTGTTGKIQTGRKTPNKRTIEAVQGALSNTRNTSAPGSDRIKWGLLKVLKDTRLGTAVLEDLSQMSEVENRYNGEEEWRHMVMVMIPKPGIF